METLLTQCRVFRYLWRGQITKGFGRVIETRSAEHPGGMVDKTHQANGQYRVVPFAAVIA